MIRSHVAADILAAIETCMRTYLGPNRCDEYLFLRSRGIPPADCNSIAVTYTDRGVAHIGDCAHTTAYSPCPDYIATLGMRVVITRICLRPDVGAGGSFDAVAEDAEAACFMDDLDALEACIMCGDWRQIGVDHRVAKLRYDGTSEDVETEGGGYSAYLDITLVGSECCT